MFLFLLLLLSACGHTRTEHHVFPTCLLKQRGQPCDIDTFDVSDRVCVRWHNGYGSDMECWPAPKD